MGSRSHTGNLNVRADRVAWLTAEVAQLARRIKRLQRERARKLVLLARARKGRA